MQIALALYPKFTALDIIGPFQVLADVPGHDVEFVAGEAGPVVDHTGRCPLVATATFADMTAPDVVVVPGELFADWDGRLVEWLRQVHPRTNWTTSVCTGSLYLAAAGGGDGASGTIRLGDAKTYSGENAGVNTGRDAPVLACHEEARHVPHPDEPGCRMAPPGPNQPRTPGAEAEHVEASGSMANTSSVVLRRS